MTFGSTDLSNTTIGANQVPVSAVYVPGTAGSNLTAMEGMAINTDSNNQKSAAGRVGLKDGDDATQGATTDAAVTGDNAGTLSAKLRGLSKILADIWDSVNHRIKVDGSGVTQPVSGTITANAGANLNTSALALESGGHLANIDTHTPALGQSTKANSVPVTLASDQPVISTNITDITATGNITTASGAGSTVTATFGAGVTSWSVDLRGTFSAGTTLQFEGTIDGTNFFSVFGVPIGATTDAPVSSVTGGAALQYQGNATGLQQFRIRCSALQASDNVTTKIVGSVASDGGFITKALPPGSNVIGATTIQATSGTALVADQSGTELRASLYGTLTTAGDTAIGVDASNRIKIAPAPANAAVIIGQIKLTDGTNIANVLPATSVSNAATAQAAQLIAGAFAEQASLSAGSLNANLVPSTDVSNYKWVSLHINTSAYSGTLTFQGSNDNTNWVSVFLWQINNPNAQVAGTTTGGTNQIWVGLLSMRYFRVAMTSYTSGTAQGTCEFYAQAPNLPVSVINAVQNGTWTVQPGNTANTTPWLVSGSNNNAVQAANTAGNVVVKGSAGLLVGAIITATGTVGLTVYDNASTNSGTQVLVIPANPTVGQLFPVNGWCKNGIVSAGVANCPGVTFFFS